MIHAEMQIVVAAILASGGMNATGHDHNAAKMVARFKEVLEELQKSDAVPVVR